MPKTIDVKETPVTPTTPPDQLKDLKLVDVFLNVPETVKTKTGLDKFHLVVDKNTSTLIQRATDGLLTSRKLPVDVRSIGIGDVVSIFITTTRPNITPDDAVKAAQRYYTSWIEDAKKDAWTLAITYDNQLTSEPRPVAEKSKEDDLPAWAKAYADVPEPARDLTDPYERRLKQLEDFIDDCGPLFELSFTPELNNSIGKALRMIQEASTDSDGFRPTLVSKEVSVPAVSENGDLGNRPENGSPG